MIAMANKAKKSEHVGPKKSRGAYAGRKRDAKHESNKLRRRQTVAAAVHYELVCQEKELSEKASKRGRMGEA
ncbi:MAG: hypothetical protein A3I78_06935 [Gammaproteobacteria bacterium RIFCSPLOWO2_02_FULL_56_15]|nr:MAG: hypothetical protein A3I78_06935 [Gammaproteobacteria bacterium RIFCSPLOWO2_02_FULL_56_15]